jgi:hypothetical protein
MAAITQARKTMSPLTGVIAISLALHFNCKTGQCNPGYTRLAKSADCTLFSAKRACRELERDGWIRRKPGGGRDKTGFDLLGPVSTPDTPDAEQLVQQLVDDVGLDVTLQFRDSFDGDDETATAILVKMTTWPKKARIAYVEQTLERRHAL